MPSGNSALADCRRTVVNQVLWISDMVNWFFVKVTSVLRVLVLPQVTMFQGRVYVTYLTQLLSHDLMLVCCGKALSVYYHSDNFMLLLSVGSVAPFVLSVIKVWRLIPCPRVVEMVSNLALAFALFVLIVLGLGTFEGDLWVVYTYAMTIWPWLVLASMVSRQYIERSSGKSPLSATTDMPFLGILSAGAFVFMLTAAKALTISETIALCCLDPLVCAVCACLIAGRVRRQMHSQYIKMYGMMVGMYFLYSTGNQAVGLNNEGKTGSITVTSDHLVFLLSRFLLTLRSFYAKRAYSLAYRTTMPERPPATEDLYSIEHRPQLHRFEAFPKPVALTLDCVFDSGLRDMDFHGMGALGTLDLYSLTENAYMLPIASIGAWVTERNGITDGLVAYDFYSKGSKAQNVVINSGTDDVRTNAIEIFETTTRGDWTLAIGVVVVFCIARVLIPYTVSRTLFDRSSSMHSWKYQPTVLYVPFFFYDVLYANEKITNFQIMCLIILVGIASHYRHLLWESFKRKYLLLVTQDLYYEQPSCIRSMHKKGLLEVYKDGCVDEFQLVLLETAMTRGANFRELVRDKNMKVWDPSPAGTAAWKLALSVVQKSLRQSTLKKKKADEERLEMYAWIGNKVEDCVDRALEICLDERAYLRRRGVLRTYLMRKVGIKALLKNKKDSVGKHRPKRIRWVVGANPTAFPRVPAPHFNANSLGKPVKLQFASPATTFVSDSSSIA